MPARRLYLAQGGYLRMNRNNRAGILEGVTFLHPEFTVVLTTEFSD